MNRDLLAILRDLDLDEVGRVRKIHQLYQSVLSGITQEKVHAKITDPLAVLEIYPQIALQCLIQVRLEQLSWLERHPEKEDSTTNITIELYEDTASSKAELSPE